MSITRIKNNQITDLTVNAAAKLQDYSITSIKIANNLTYNSDLAVTGNLTVSGNTTTISTVDLVVEDPLILLAKNQTGTPALDIGFIGKRGTEDNIAFVWDESTDEFITAFTTSEVTNTVITINSYASFRTANLTAENGNITGNLAVGNISLTGNVANLNVTGNVAAGNFLTTGLISATGNLTSGNVNTAIVSATGNVQAGNLRTAGTISSTGTATLGNVATSGTISSTGTATLGNVVSGGTASVTGNITGGNLNTAGQVSATANVTGGNVNTGGVVSSTGNVIGGNITTAGQMSATGTGTFGNVATSGTISSTGTATLGNVVTSGTISSTGTATLGNIVSSGTASVTGNITGGNLNTAGVVSATGNVQAGNLRTAGTISSTGAITTAAGVTATGTITGGNLATGGTISSTGTATLGNVVSSGTASITGNITGGNVNTGIVSASGNVQGGNLRTAGQISATGNITTAATIVANTISPVSGDLSLTGTNLQWDGSGNIVMNGQWINNLSDPVQAQDAATKEYVDNAVSTGITIHTPVRLEANLAIGGTYAQGGTTATVTDTIAGNTVVFSSAINPQPNDQLWFTNSFNGILGNTPYFVVSAPNTSAAVLSRTYSGAPVTDITNGSSLTQAVRINSGQGATLTNNGANATLVIDGVTVSNGDRVLIYSEANAAYNGVYDVTEAGNATTAWQLTRSSDMDTYIPDDVNGVDAGDYIYVQAGDSGAGESYVMTAPIGPVIIGYDPLTFTQFSASQVYSANTAAGIVLNGTIFSAKVDNNTTAFDGGGNIIVKAGANLTTPNIGAATGTSLSVTGNVTGGNLNTAGAVSATGNVNSGNVNTAIVSATGNVQAGNLRTAGTISSTGAITTAAGVTATGTITGGNLATGGTISSTGTATLGNVATSGTVSATGNITGGNLLYGSGVVSGTGNIFGGNSSFTGNVTAANFIGNISGNIDAAGANTQVQFNDTGDILGASANFTFNKANNTLTVSNGNIVGGNLQTGGFVSATGNITGGNMLTAGIQSSTGNVIGGNVLTSGLISATGTITTAAGVTATGNVTGGNITTAGQVTATGNITGGNLVTAGLATVTGNVQGGNIRTAGQMSATGNITGANLILTSGFVDGPASGRITINGSDADVDFAIDGDTVANVFYVDAGLGTASFGTSNAIANAIVNFDTTTSVKMPVGNIAQRPDPAVIGMVRYSTTSDALEVYTPGGWENVGVPEFTVITADKFDGDGSTVQFTLTEDSTTAATIVSINGVVQQPITAYAVSGNVLTFTEAPESTDVIDARIVTTTTTVTQITNVSANAVVAVEDTSNDVVITGDLVPFANLGGNLGADTRRWDDLYLSGNTIYLGSLQLKEINATTFGVFQSDGTTTADLDVGNIDVAALSQGTSTIGIAGINGNAYVTVAGTANVAVVNTGGVVVTGNISATGNVTAQDVNSLSDAVLKTNISPLSGVDAVINSLTGVEYDWKNGSGHSYGFLAQDVEKILPSAVKTGADGLKSINYMMIIPFLVETIKQLGAEVAELKKKLD